MESETGQYFKNNICLRNELFPNKWSFIIITFKFCNSIFISIPWYNLESIKSKFSIIFFDFL
jgi:hypothetical protein